MVRTAPAQRAGLLGAFPELRQYGRTAARLHPRPGSPTEQESSVGGPLLWPEAEAWPVCTERHWAPLDVGLEEEDPGHGALHRLIASLGARFTQPASPVRMVPVLQLYRADAPGVFYPRGMDLLQILWCPERHDKPAGGPQPQVVWRRAADVVPAGRPLADVGELVPVPCALHPEEVVEFPWLSRGYGHDLGPSPLPDNLQQRIAEWNGQQPKGFDYHALAIAPGWKVGGWDMLHPVCDCGASMLMLFQTSQYEYLGGGWTPHDEPGFRWGDPESAAEQQPTGVTIGREECLTIHICPADPGHPIQTTVN